MISLVTLLIIILVLFMLLQLMPGSPFNDEKLTADQIAMMSKKYGLDKPLIVQFFTYVKNLLQGDFGVSESCSRLFDAIRERFGSLDVLVNNAGISYIGLFQDMTPDEWNHILNTNLTSVFNCCRLAIPMMVSRKSGRILNISSVWGICGASCEVAYSATKGGINAMTRALAKELAPSSIQVNAIACGAIDTEMNQFLDEEERNALLEEIPAGRMGRAEEVGKLAYQLGSENSYLTGQIIQLDGGWI